MIWCHILDLNFGIQSELCLGFDQYRDRKRGRATLTVSCQLLGFGENHSGAVGTIRIRPSNPAGKAFTRSMS
jgi:hypothetical protein